MSDAVGKLAMTDSSSPNEPPSKAADRRNRDGDSSEKLEQDEPLVDCEPLGDVWQQFGEQLRRRARTRLRQYGLAGQAESMDICNDVMADMTRRYGNQPLTPDDVLSYLMRAIDNQVLDTFRTLARQCRDFRRNDGGPVDDLPLANREASPSQIALRREVLSRIRSVLGERDAVAIDMMLENRVWNEIGESLGLKPDAARMRVRRALDRARQDLGLGNESQ